MNEGTPPSVRAADGDSRFVTEQGQIAAEVPPLATAPRPDKQYDMRRLSYAGTFKNPFKAGTIRTIEWLTAKVTLLRLIRSFEKAGAPSALPSGPRRSATWASASTRPPKRSP